MAPVDVDAIAAEIIDACAGSEAVEDYDLQIHAAVIVRGRIQLSRGFLDFYRNLDTGTTAYAWILDGHRVFGADNTGGWHRHPHDAPEDHIPCPAVSFPEFLEEVEALLHASGGA